jgi:hypothetical protein
VSPHHRQFPRGQLALARSIHRLHRAYLKRKEIKSTIGRRSWLIGSGPKEKGLRPIISGIRRSRTKRRNVQPYVRRFSQSKKGSTELNCDITSLRYAIFWRSAGIIASLRQTPKKLFIGTLRYCSTEINLLTHEADDQTVIHTSLRNSWDPLGSTSAQEGKDQINYY